MISADLSLKPQGAVPRKNPISSLAGLSKPRTIADSVTESAANNALAAGYQSGARTGEGQAGFSKSAMDRMRSAQREAAGVAEGASNAAGIRSEDQAFNASQNAAWDAMVEERINNNASANLGMNAANFERLMSGKQNRWSLQMARSRASQALRLALLSRLG